MRLTPIPALIAVFSTFVLAQGTGQGTGQATGDTPPSLIYRNEPEYSAEATRARVQSSVTLSIIVGEDGKAHDIKVAQGAGFGLDEKAIEAMDKWRFNPGTHEGHPAPVPANIEMNFSILARNDPEDHSGQRARLNFTLPPDTTRPELVAGKIPPNPTAPGEQTLHFHLQVDKDGVPKNITLLDSNDPAWAKQVTKILQIWRFRPAMLNGNFVQVEADFEMAHSGGLESSGTVAVQEAAREDEPPVPVVTAARVPAPIPVTGLSPRSHHTATLLPNGTVLLAGGAAQGPSAQIFDWATRHIVNTGDMAESRSDHTATLLRDGTVLIVGGHTTKPVASAEIFDPSTGRFSKTGSLREARESHVAAMLPDGRVLICGGTGVAGKALASTEIYDPKTKTFSRGATMTAARASFNAVALKDGSILLLGGAGPAGSTAEIYDPTLGAFRAAGSMASPLAGFSATRLGSGKVLVAGGDATAELYDPTTKSFQPTGPMSQPRPNHDALLLNNGKVLISGGIASTEIYDPASATFSPGPKLGEVYGGHTSTLLQDGSVLIAGSSAELILIK